MSELFRVFLREVAPIGGNRATSYLELAPISAIAAMPTANPLPISTM